MSLPPFVGDSTPEEILAKLGGVKLLAPAELDALRGVSMEDLKRLGHPATPAGYTKFCQATRNSSDFMCPPKAPRKTRNSIRNSKEGYATYLKTVGFLQQVFDVVYSADVFTQSAKVQRVALAKHNLVLKANASGNCLIGLTNPQIETIAHVTGTDIRGLNRVEACAALTENPLAASSFPEYFGPNVSKVALSRKTPLDESGFDAYVRRRVKPKSAPKSVAEYMAGPKPWGTPPTVTDVPDAQVQKALTRKKRAPRKDYRGLGA